MAIPLIEAFARPAVVGSSVRQVSSAPSEVTLLFWFAGLFAVFCV